ncbi:MAG TPA: ankyrin repeat domain-containing protein, partial [Vicinamibacterales bacterium]|nr:ankyrin repeat domain-containing protein [Vicinamibacterales bacterium]
MSTLDNLKKEAKRWLKALRAGDRSARERLRRAYPNAPRVAGLRDAQHALAREGGHENWIALTRDVDAGSTSSPLEALLRAAGRGDADAVARILIEEPSLLDQRGSIGDSGLRTALHFGVHHEAVVCVLLERGADPNVRDEGDHAYPIHFAAERGELPIVKLLVEHGADPQGAGTSHQLDAVGWAVCFDYAYHVDVARYLLAHGAVYTLTTAVALGEADAIRETTRRGEDVNQRMDRTNRRRTPLHLAAIKKQPASLSTLLELGADPNLADAAGLTPLDQAVILSEREMAERLLDRGARITAAAAILLERREDFERLVAANPELMNDDRLWGRLLVQAAGRASARVIDQILKVVERQRAGLSIVNVQDDPETAVDGVHGYTPLHAAAWAGNTDVVRLLLKRGADPRVRDSKWKATAAGWAAHAGHTDTANVILEADVDIFQAVNFDRGDRVAQILDRDPAAIARPFKSYASFPSQAGQWWPEPDCMPLDWAVSQKKENAARVLTERGGRLSTLADISHARRVAMFLESACWDHHVHGKGDHRMYDRAAQRLLAEDPTIATNSVYTAVVSGEIDTVRRILADRPEAAAEAGGARRWTPLLYLAYARFTHPKTTANAIEIARLLLDTGANPNDFYMAGDS